MFFRRPSTTNGPLSPAGDREVGMKAAATARAAPTERRRFRRAVTASALAALSVVSLTATPAVAAATRQGIVDATVDQLGGKSCNPGYHNSCGINWCAEFARWVWGTAGVNDLAGLNSWAQSFKSYGTSRGLYHSRSSGYTPQPGDAIIFDWDHSSGDDHPIDHVAIVTSVSSSRVFTIGGNQGGGGHYNSKVSKANYQRSFSDIDGYVSPAGVGGGTVVDEAMRGDSVTGDSFTDLVATRADGTMVMYANNIIRDDGVPYDAATNIGHGWGSGFDQVVTADVTGDGYSDLVARKTDGTLWLYPNNIERDNGTPYNDGKKIGQGWNQYDKLVGADVTGDGFTDLVARKSDGTLWLYANNIVRDDGVPFNAGKEIGSRGWGAFDTLTGADVTGDGFTDLVARKTDGTLMLYPNNIVRDNGMPYSGSSREIGSGWDTFTAVVGSDVTGDGFTDLVARKSDGTLWLYPNNIGRDNGVPYSGSTAQQIGSGWNGFNRIL